MPIKFVFDGYRLKPKPSYQTCFRCLAFFLMATVVNYFLMLIELVFDVSPSKRRVHNLLFTGVWEPQVGLELWQGLYLLYLDS